MPKIKDDSPPPEDERIAAVERVTHEITRLIFCGSSLEKKCAQPGGLQSKADFAVFESALLHMGALRDFLMNRRPGLEDAPKRARPEDDEWMLVLSEQGLNRNQCDPLPRLLGRRLDKYLSSMRAARAKARRNLHVFAWEWKIMEREVLMALQPFLGDLETWLRDGKAAVPAGTRDSVIALGVSVTNRLLAIDRAPVQQSPAVNSLPSEEENEGRNNHLQ